MNILRFYHVINLWRYLLLHSIYISVSREQTHVCTSRTPACSRTICYIVPSNFTSDSSLRPQESIYMETNGTSVSDVQSSCAQCMARLDNFFVPYILHDIAKDICFHKLLTWLFSRWTLQKIIGFRSCKIQDLLSVLRWNFKPTLIPVFSSRSSPLSSLAPTTDSTIG